MMGTFLLILSAACLAWGLGLALTFRIIPAVAHAVEARHPIHHVHAAAQRLTLTVAALLLILGGTNAR